VRRWRFSSLPLRSRLAILTASAVAVAIAMAVCACWIITRQLLLAQLDHDLHAQTLNPHEAQLICSPLPNTVLHLPFVTRIIQPDGSQCAVPGQTAIAVQNQDMLVATGTARDETFYAHDSKGDPVRVFTRGFDGVAISFAQPLNVVNDQLKELALILALVGGFGVLGSASAGLGIARAGLRPVDQLTDAVEHVARTEDLAIRIPVEGEDEIARLSAAFNSMTSQLASSRERQQQLIADAGHELRTPLTSLRTNIDLLVRSEETGRALPADDRMAIMQSVKAQMAELALLIGDLQELSRPEAAPGSGPLQVVALHDVAEQAVRRARLRGPDLIVDARLEPWYVRAEPASMERALVNLLDNAVKFSPSGGTVDVRLQRGQFTVRDHGPGIPPEDLPHVFERFWRSPSARSLPGSGLGLSIVARTIQHAGGTVSLQAAQGGGTIAVVNLPGAPSAPPDAVED
jgi:two-component system, OmpR family, sensor histidine kinase MprB